MILVSNGIAGGFPMSILLLRPELDQWRPGEQVGIFQGNGLAFVAATELLTQWNEQSVSEIAQRSQVLSDALLHIPVSFPNRNVRTRGLGMLWGVDFGAPASASVLSAWALERGVVVEPARIKDNVLLVMPPLTIEDPVLRDGLDRLGQAIAMFFNHQ